MTEEIHPKAPEIQKGHQKRRDWPKARNLRGVRSLLKMLDMKGPKYLEICSVWDWIDAEGKLVGYNVYKDPLRTHEILISVMYVWSALYGEFPSITELLKISKSNIQDHIHWESSELGKFCARLETKLAERRAKSRFGRMMGFLEELAAKKDRYSLNAISAYLEATGKKHGEGDGTDGIVVQIIDNPLDSSQVTPVVAPEAEETPIQQGTVEDFASGFRREVKRDGMGDIRRVGKKHHHGVAKQLQDRDTKDLNAPQDPAGQQDPIA